MLPHAEDSKQEKEDILDYGDKHITWYHWILLNRPLKVVVAFVLLSVFTPPLIYHFLFFASEDLPPADGFSIGSCLLPRTSRLPCGVGYMNASDCHSQCCFDTESNYCFHRFPSRFTYITDWNWSQSTMLQPRISTTPYNQNSLPQIRLSIDEISSTHLSLTFYNPQEVNIEGRRLEEKDYVYNISIPEVHVVVNGTQGTVFNTARGPMIASDNIWEISFVLTDETMYGLGEIPLKGNTVKVLYNHDGGVNSLPLIFAKVNESYHGLLIDVKDPTEVIITEDNQIIVRSITTKGLKFHIFVGPNPKDVTNDVMKMIGFNVELEYWMLGAHVCSEFSESPSKAYDRLTEFLSNASKEQLPYDSHCGVSPITFNDDICKEKDDFVEEGANAVHKADRKFIPHVSPFIHYEYEIEESNVASKEIDDGSDLNNNKHNNQCSIVDKYEKFMIRLEKSSKNQKNETIYELYNGLVSDKTVVYPDYKSVPKDFVSKIWKYDIELDGIISQNDWPLDESLKFVNETKKYLPYFSENFEEAFNNTPKWNSTRANGELYFRAHNEYGNDFANAIQSITNRQTPIWTTAQRMNGNVIVNRQNINASWTNFHKELVEAALAGASGQFFWSSPVCGDNEFFNITTQAHLCVKWYLAATYLPMIKIHSKTVPRDPLSFVGTNRMLILTALRNRLSLIPYFYTTLQNGPLLRPMFYQFPKSDRLKDLTSQFSVGEDLLIVPNTHPSQNNVHIMMPPGSWYELWSGLPVIGNDTETVTMTTTDADFLTLIRGGSIVVLQKNTEQTAEQTRRNSEYSLKIALQCENAPTRNTDDRECKANGKLFMTKDTTLVFEANSRQLTVTVDGDTKAFCGPEAIWARNIKELDVYGLKDTSNNYDHHRNIVLNPAIDLCELEYKNNIVIDYFFIKE